MWAVPHGSLKDECHPYVSLLSSASILLVGVEELFQEAPRQEIYEYVGGDFSVYTFPIAQLVT